MKFTRFGKNKVEKAFLKKGLRVERLAKQNAPVDSGRLQNSITTKVVERGGTKYVVVGTNVEYARHVEFGTDPYIIEPDEAEALNWTDPETGEEVFAKKVEHPGIPAQPFLFPAFDKVRGENR